MSHDTFWRLLKEPGGRGRPAGQSAAAAAADPFGHNFAQDSTSAADREEIERYLLVPGPDVVVIDEAHRIKNESARLSTALHRMATKRRLLLTGTPLQNNLMEYFHMVDFVDPRKLGDLQTFRTLFVEHINRGAVSYNDADDRKRRKAMDRRVHMLSNKLNSLVQRCGQVRIATMEPTL